MLAATFTEIFARGGLVMWPLLGLSVIAVTLMLERAWFFYTTNRRGRLGRVSAMGKALRTGRHQDAKQQAVADRSVYGDAVRRMLDEQVTEAGALDAIEQQRARLERFLPILSTIITAAPMLGILGTVLGIIRSFDVLAGGRADLDLNVLAGGIAEALITTAAGITVALLTLFPYNAFRAQVDRSISRLESLAAAALQDDTSKPTG
ncbi:MAG: MotA/TolQ/ExbB proton channel family protein [Planctomycetota bacterium]